MTAFYNEIDPYAAQWLRELINARHIAPGVVDERSIDEIRPDELVEFTQCHFFAGIGVWSLSLRNAGWPDSRPVWTGSCPCQPFSSAGKGTGFDDERHLWPAWQWLISECNPPAIFGEQVASKAAEDWIDLVQADMEGMGYAFGCVPIPSAGVGAPHIRDRAYWVGHSSKPRSQGHARNVSTSPRQTPVRSASETGLSGGMAHTSGQRHDKAREGNASSGGCCTSGDGTIERVEYTDDQYEESAGNQTRAIDIGGTGIDFKMASQQGRTDKAHPTNGIWGGADWLLCRDGKIRPVEPGTFPLADGIAARVGRLRGYGNAINAEAGQKFIEVAIEIIRDRETA